MNQGHVRLNNTQFAKLGFTDLFRVRYQDLTTAVNNTAQSLTLMALAFGDFVYQPKSLIEIVTPGTGLATFTGELGITGATTQIIGASDLTPAALTGYAPANSVAPYITPTGGKNLLFTVRPGAAEALTAATAGEFLIWMYISRYSERAQGIQF